jgi:hypothetical protein
VTSADAISIFERARRIAYRPSTRNGDRPALLAGAATSVKLGIAAGLFAGFGDAATWSGIALQAAGYLAVLVAVLVNRRPLLLVAAAYVGLSAVAAVVALGTEAGRIAPLATSALLLAALLGQAAALDRVQFPAGRRFGLACAVAAFAGVALAPAVGELNDAASTSPVAPATIADFVPRAAKAELTRHLGPLTSDEQSCAFTAMFHEFGLTTLIALSAREPTDAEQATMSGLVERCRAQRPPGR